MQRFYGLCAVGNILKMFQTFKILHGVKQGLLELEVRHFGEIEERFREQFIDPSRAPLRV